MPEVLLVVVLPLSLVELQVLETEEMGELEQMLEMDLLVYQMLLSHPMVELVVVVVPVVKVMLLEETEVVVEMVEHHLAHLIQDHLQRLLVY